MQAFILTPAKELTVFTPQSMTATYLRGYLTFSSKPADQVLAHLKAAGFTYGGAAWSFTAATLEAAQQYVALINTLPGVVLAKGAASDWQTLLVETFGYAGGWAMYPTFGDLHPNAAVFSQRPDMSQANPFKPNRDSAEWNAYCLINAKAK